MIFSLHQECRIWKHYKKWEKPEFSLYLATSFSSPNLATGSVCKLRCLWMLLFKSITLVLPTSTQNEQHATKTSKIIFITYRCKLGFRFSTWNAKKNTNNIQNLSTKKDWISGKKKAFPCCVCYVQMAMLSRTLTSCLISTTFVFVEGFFCIYYQPALYVREAFLNSILPNNISQDFNWGMIVLCIHTDYIF